ncbi:S-adenosylmethionine:tRNA ribosyltransferase-isomerase [Pseudolycoriella hygida]|uniref:S-adenosylmethionine:tRNA ribosyltransferase-isomerase n=1 Tax=Pseudolycoriella hygida TaxID=35572 RepID=A0A9Q0S6G0_9DIPT|nr:S-adenosylmethionine:tRNA ribosyltransferase-isomerase [Pseudolycoriella hygida]
MLETLNNIFCCMLKEQTVSDIMYHFVTVHIVSNLDNILFISRTKLMGITVNRLLAKLAYAEEFEGDASPRTAAYSNVREDLSTASTYKLPAEVEFCKKSNENLISRTH